MFFDKIKQSLQKTKDAIGSKFDDVFGKNKRTEDIIDEIEEIFILSDMGMQVSTKICDNLRIRIKKEKIENEDKIKEVLREEMKIILQGKDNEFVIDEKFDEKTVILVTGVNGVGKTTSIGKLANRFNKSGKKILLAAADTFRAGAVEQIAIWADRCGVELVKGKENEDPASVIFEATKKMHDEDYDILICDTAGRLQNKKNLMDELEKMNKIIDKNLPDVKKEVYIVLDSTTGQNALVQAKSFYEKTGVNGIILTKLDGTAKGGIVFAIVNELEIPVRYIGIGEQIDDIEEFNVEKFVESII